MGANDYAIVVGVNRYPELGDLEGPENDACSFRDWLLAPDGGNVPAANVRVILSSDYQPAPDDVPEPTTEKFKAAVDALHEKGTENGGKAGERLYLFLAGHGFAPDLESAALLMANAAARRTGHHVPGKSYANWFRQSAFFDEVVLFMDCCRENYPRAPVQPVHLETITGAKPARCFYGFATEWARAAREGSFGDNVVQGRFTAALVSGLKGARDEGGSVTGKTLKGFVHNWLAQHAPDLPGSPEFAPDDSDDFVFVTGQGAAYRLRVTVANGDGRPVQVLAGDLSEVPVTQQAGATWEWALPARGIYKYGFVGDASQYVEILGDREVVDVTL